MDEYSREFKEILKNRLEVPDKKDKEEVTGLLLGHGTDKEEVQSLLETCTLHLSDDGRNFLQQYSQTIEENLEWAKNLDSTQSVLSKENEYRMLLSLAEQLVDELETAVGEENELESIARKLEDAHLLAEVDYEKEQTQKMSEKLSGLLKRREKLQALLEEIENLNEFVESHEILQALKHRQKVIEIMLEKSVEASERRDGKRKIFIDKDFLQSIQNAARNYNEEISGIFVCRREGKDWTVVKTIQTGIGTEGSVSPDESRIQAVNELIENYAKYRLVEFHTHSIGTIERHGPGYAHEWSKIDHQNFKEQGEGYIGVLVTPEKVLVKGNKGDPRLQTFDRKSSSEFSEWREEFENEWNEIKSSYSFSDLPEPTEFSGGD